MRVRGLICVVAGGVALVVPGVALGDTMIGQYDQNGDQGVNSTQAGIQSAGGPGYSVPGEKVVTGSSKGTETQDSTNVAESVETIGSGSPTGAVIGNASQENGQGINSAQGAKKGKQTSTNFEGSGEIIAPDDGDTIVGTTGQENRQAENSSQMLSSTPSGALLFTQSTGGSTTQESLNAEVSAVILG
jgi:hypothetical protein